jgi:ankyrin repeat protein
MCLVHVRRGIPHFSLQLAALVVATAVMSLCSSCNSGPKAGIAKAAFDGDVNTVRSLLASDKSLVFDKDNYNTTPLHWAAQKNHKEIAELLLANGADVNALNLYGDTPLHFAASAGSYDVAKVLLDHDAEVNIVDKPPPSETPFHSARTEGHQDLARLLAEHGGHD